MKNPKELIESNQSSEEIVVHLTELSIEDKLKIKELRRELNQEMAKQNNRPSHKRSYARADQIEARIERIQAGGRY